MTAPVPVPSSVFEGFSISHAQIMDGVETFADTALASASVEALDIYGVADASIDPNIDQYENKGDDVTMSTWSWLNYADLKVSAGYISMPLIASITGDAVTTTGVGDDLTFEQDLWSERAMNTKPRPVLLRMPSKDKNKMLRHLTIGLYSVQFSPVKFDGPKYKEGLKTNWEGRAMFSAFDEVGVVFADGLRRVGKLISHA